MSSIIVDRNKHESFLADHRKDPYTHQLIEAGDKIVICAKCKTVYLESSWNVKKHCFINTKNCESTETLYDIPKQKNITTLKSVKKKGNGWAITFATLFVVASILAIYFYATTKPRTFADIEKVWAVHNITNEEGLMGMEIYVQFSTYGMLDKQGIVVAYFYDDNGNMLIASDDSDSLYKTSDNHLAIAANFTTVPIEEASDSFVLFMPYSTFIDIYKTSTQREVSLKFDVRIFDHKNKQIAISEIHSFSVWW